MTSELNKAAACGGCGNADPAERCLNCMHDFGQSAQPAEAEGLEVVAWRWRLRDKSRWAFAETAPHSLIGVPDIDCDALVLKSDADARITALQAEVERLTKERDDARQEVARYWTSADMRPWVEMADGKGLPQFGKKLLGMFNRAMNAEDEARRECARATIAEPSLASARQQIDALTEALTPSGETKAAYIGEFTIAVERHVDEDGEVDDEAEGHADPYEHITVPWTTIKEIMAAIRARAALKGGSNG